MEAKEDVEKKLAGIFSHFNIHFEELHIKSCFFLWIPETQNEKDENYENVWCSRSYHFIYTVLKHY